MTFLERGWTAQKVTPDYGEDLMVRIFDINGQSTPYIFFVQVKGTQEHEFIIKRNQYDFLIEKPHYDSWMTFWQPVFLVVWDHGKKTGRWDWVQEPKKAPTTSKEGKIILGLPHDLTEDGLKLMEGLVRQYYRAFFIQDALRADVFRILKDEHGIDVSVNGDVASIQVGKKLDVLLAENSADRFVELGRAIREKVPGLSDEDVASYIQKGLGTTLSIWGRKHDSDPEAFEQEFRDDVASMKEADARRANEEPHNNE